jgi:hypothetical protein
MHIEPIDPEDPKGRQKVVVDHLERWKGTRKKPVQIEDVETWLLRTSVAYNRAKVYADPNQFEGSLQRFSRLGIRAEKWNFTTTTVGLVASALVQAFRNSQIEVPDIDSLRDELLRVRLRESSPGVTRLDHDKGAHDDQAVTIGMGCHILLGGLWSSGDVFKAFMHEMKVRKEQKGSAAQRDERALRISTQRVNGRRRQLGAERVRAVSHCEHRWREGRCVYCPALESEEANELAGRSQAASAGRNRGPRG